MRKTFKAKENLPKNQIWILGRLMGYFFLFFFLLSENPPKPLIIAM